MTDFRQRLVAALQPAEPGYDERHRLQGGRPAGVLLLFGARASPGKSVVAENAELLLTRRTEQVGSHKGQIAFPGGASEPEEIELGETGLVNTALREAHEEVGIPPSVVELVGRLPEMTTITHYRVSPVVALLRQPIEDQPLLLNADEIAEAFWVPLSVLMAPQTYRLERIRVGQVNYPIHVYQVGDHRIWGATASMIKNLLDRLRTLG